MKYLKLFETFKSQKELEELSEHILTVIGDETFNREKHVSYRKIKSFEKVSLQDINNKYYDELKDFIENTNLTIAIPSPREFEKISGESEASYVVPKSSDKKYILLKPSMYLFDKSNEYISRDGENDDQINDNINGLLIHEYSINLLHELQHAYDDYRSDGEALKSKNPYRDKDTQEIASKKIEDIKEDEVDYISKKYNEYLNLPYEVDARFTQAIKYVDFYEFDLDSSLDNNKDVYSMRIFSEILKDFKRVYYFKQLDDKQRRRVLQKLGKFYELEKDFIKMKNEAAEEYE